MREAVKQALIGDVIKSLRRKEAPSADSATSEVNEAGKDSGRDTSNADNRARSTGASVARSLAVAGAAANLDMPKGEAGGHPYGVVGGGNPNASSSPLKQSVFGAVQLAAGVIDFSGIAKAAATALARRLLGAGAEKIAEKAAVEAGEKALREGMAKEAAEKLASEAAEKSIREATQSALRTQVREIKNTLEKEIFEAANLSKTGRSGGAIGAQLDMKLGNRLVQEANKVKSSFPELAAELKKEGNRLLLRGKSGTHK
jgi:hypothetical protein